MLDGLIPFLPEGALPLIKKMLANEQYHLVITRPRVSKLGDFRAPRQGRTPRITVNGNLNPYDSLITLVHEIAHLKIWNKHKNTVKPHGHEWKRLYSSYLIRFVQADIFPEDLAPVVREHVRNPGYSVQSNMDLAVALKKYDVHKTDVHYVQDLAPGEYFAYRKNLYQVEEKLRKNYLCLQVFSGKNYKFSGLAEVDPMPDDLVAMLDIPKKERQPEVKPEPESALAKLSKGQQFKLQGRVFALEKKLRKYYLCKEVASGQSFRIHPQAAIQVL